MDENRYLIRSLLECEVFRIGNFLLKSGAFSPVYIDLRRIIHYPKVVKALAVAFRDLQSKENLKAETVCGVPYTALPVASVFSVLYNVPMVMRRKEAKNYGTKRMVEGNFSAGDKCLILEDIISSGTSIVETTEALRKEGLHVQDCLVVVNRNQGGPENLKKIGINLYQLFDVNDIFSAYCSLNKVEADLIDKVNLYFTQNSYVPVHKSSLIPSVPFSKRAESCNHPVSKRLFDIMEIKKTNLCVAVDTLCSEELLKLAEQLGPHICMLKTHVDILNDFTVEVTLKLKRLSEIHRFLIFEDRKFADIGNTVKYQYTEGLYKIQNWADIVTLHGLPGDGIIEALKDSVIGKSRACVLVAEMSSKGALTNPEYCENIFKMADRHPDFVIGYIAQNNNINSKSLIHMCPGINISVSGDSLGQQYKSPEEAISNGADIIIVGRGICNAHDIISSAVNYKTRGYNAYLNNLPK